jgi:hypothetical protein
MTPTGYLRFIERDEPHYPGSDTGRVDRVLQQFWEDSWGGDKYLGIPGCWEDVPLFKEPSE